MLRQRIISALVGIPIIIAFLFLGRIPFFVLVVVLALAGLDEFYRMGRSKEENPFTVFGMLAGIALCAAALLRGEAGFSMVTVLLIMVVLVWNYSGIGNGGIAALTFTVFGALYIGLMFSYLILIRGMNEHGPELVLLIFIATWVYDIVAYSAGSAIGRNKLAPQISPGKTWEGAICGALATVLVLGALFFIPWFSWEKRILLGLVVGVASPFGDLAESKLKREAGIKDTSSRIPGHGGILDRFDSLLFTAPISYYLLKLLF
jgi:phosphatidate cytidylyltransferase